MNKSYFSLGLMSGTSGDGVDASIIQSDGDTKYKVIYEQYFQYSQHLYKEIHSLKDKIKEPKDLKKSLKEIKNLEKEITLFHADVVNKIIDKSKSNINFVGFHGQTIFHDSKEKISKQLGDGKLLSRLIKKTVIYNFRQNDLKNGGEGAPLTPAFHQLLVKQNKIKKPTIIINLGGITNYTYVGEKDKFSFLHSADIGPGNCLIDQWVKKKSKQKYDKNGFLAESGKVNKEILNKALKSWKKYFFKRKRSYDVKDFDLTFINDLSLENGAATLTEYTSSIIAEFINEIPNVNNVIVCGGGRKNNSLFKKISKKLKYSFQSIDDLGMDGDFIESQAFAYLAIRSILKLPISFPSTTGVNNDCTGGVIVRY